MPRLKHVSTGAVVDVSDDKVDRLGSEWEPVKDAPKRTATKQADKK